MKTDGIKTTMKRAAGLIVVASMVPLLWLTGCGAGNVKTTSVVQSSSVTGRFMGGQQPVAGTTVQLYETGIGGYGSASTPLGSSVQTTTNGNFTLPAYTCDSDRVLYVVGTGGQPIPATQSSAAVTNNNLAMVGILGVCGISVSPYIGVNELSTVATVWALQPFMTDVSHIATAPTNVPGLIDAVQVAYELVDPQTGQEPGSPIPAGATIPAAEINTLADILELCVNSGGGAYGDSSSCGNLFALAPGANGTTYPADTITAALNIAKNPARNVSALNRLRSASPVFQPALDVNSPPTSWTVAITYMSGGLNAPTGIATDASGNVWVANSGNNTVTQLDPTGSATSPGTGYTSAGLSNPSSIAVDQNGAVWVANSGNNSLVKLNSDGTTQSTTTVINGANTVAIDAGGDAILSNTNSIMTVRSSGTVQNSYTTPSPTVAVVGTTK